jgi:prepilin-type processing-associated H-X9-DG protein
VALNTAGSGRMGGIQNPSKLIFVADTDRLPDTNENYLTGEGSTNPIFLNETSDGSVNRMTYNRHRGLINVLFADGSASSRSPVGPPGATSRESKFPRGTQWVNGGAISPL